MSKSVAFVGLGNMGGGMAANLVSAGFEVKAFDLSEQAIAQAKKTGCTIATSAIEAVAGADFVVTMLPNGAIVESLYIGSDGGDSLLAAIPADALILDCSTMPQLMPVPWVPQRRRAGCILLTPRFQVVLPRRRRAP